MKFPEILIESFFMKKYLIDSGKDSLCNEKKFTVIFWNALTVVGMDAVVLRMEVASANDLMSRVSLSTKNSTL